jgi:hypothetical protein
MIPVSHCGGPLEGDSFSAIPSSQPELLTATQPLSLERGWMK